ncbi:hypothetical protein CGZ80_08185 [Rhodopirellula sp. MGV]|nr:hypothetical protein CGZ80_08185 [Rhodopirellula sp. MGV]PNY34573.1 hypothetical protein C2E31_23000 [Rhodopirellula baltica]
MQECKWGGQSLHARSHHAPDDRLGVRTSFTSVASPYLSIDDRRPNRVFATPQPVQVPASILSGKKVRGFDLVDFPVR